MNRKFQLSAIIFIFFCFLCANAADVVPTDVQQPGSQPAEVSNLESPDKCDNCHGGYDPAVEPAFNWRGSLMANAGRDPIFWATMAIAEQDFDGVGDLCLRCHATGGWMAERSTPTEGASLQDKDADGVECDFCHKMTNPDNSEHVGVQNPPFIANDEEEPPTGYYGSGMHVLWGDSHKLGPYADIDPNHQFLQSAFHRSADYCGTCHDVSNPVVGDLAHNHGARVPLDPGTFSGLPGAPVEEKAAFNNFPYQYGIVERTFSESVASLLSRTPVSSFTDLPIDLQDGAILFAYESALAAGTGGDYEDGTPRYFSCQTCHMVPVTGQGCNKNAPVRKDLPHHDMTGGNYWIPDAIQYLDLEDKLRLGRGLTATQIEALNAGAERAKNQLNLAASLSVEDNTLRIVNLTGHKLISGYPEGRRMWLNIKWYDGRENLVREDGEYGPIGVEVQGFEVESIVDLGDPNTKIYEAFYAMTQEWAVQLLTLGYPTDLALSYDRYSGAADYTLADLAAQAPETSHKTFHFALNNRIVKDNRIPPYAMGYDDARTRNVLPVPEDQYGNPGSGGSYDYWDEFTLNPPPGATSASIDLLYQPTSWEYIQFLWLANNGTIEFLANEGEYMLEAWLHTGMAAPYVMAQTTWGSPSTPGPNVKKYWIGE